MTSLPGGMQSELGAPLPATLLRSVGVRPFTALEPGAIGVATLGVVLASGASWSQAGLRPILNGIAAGALFGISAIGFRGALLALPEGGYFARALTVLVLTLGLGACQPVAQPEEPPQSEEPADGWTPLFNGKDLSGWVSSGDPDAWGVKDGEIVTLKPGRGGWLRTDRMYRDFDLSLDFWMPEGGNSGVGLRGSSGGDPAFTGFEVQILDTHGEEPGLRNCGAVYEAVAPATMAVNEPG